jgi:UDP-2,3-diacylglucosamine hydrolase
MYYFFSDVHLGLFSREKDIAIEDKLIGFLDEIQHSAKKIFILGDLFDYWFDYKKVIPANFYRIINKLTELKQSGIEIIYLMGNHDFGHFKFFKEELGIDVLDHDYLCELEGKKFYLSHGDNFVYKDYGYMIIKPILRNKLIQSIYRLVHPDFGIWLASSSSQKSRGYTDKKDYGGIDGLEIFAKQKIDEGYDFVMMGHNHLVKIIDYKQGKYINLGEWINNPSYAVFDGKNLELKYLNKEI